MHADKMMTDGAMAPLDALDTLGEYARFFPEFARGHESAEREAAAIELSEYYGKIPDSLVEDHAALTRFLRLLQALPNSSLPTFQDKIVAVQALWRLLTDGRLPEFHLQRVADALILMLHRVVGTHVSPPWMACGASALSVPHEEICRKLIDAQPDHEPCFLGCEPILAALEAWKERGFMDDVQQSSARRKASISLYVRLAATLRPFWRSEAVETLLRARYCYPHRDFMSADAYFDIRLVMLFATGEFLHANLVSGQLFDWWGPLGNRSSASWDASLLVLIFRAVKHGWSVGEPVNDILRPYQPVLMQMLNNHLGMPLPQKASLYLAKEFVPSEYSSLLPRKLNPLRKLAKIFALLLEPLEGRRRLDGAVVTQPSYEDSLWAYLEGLARLLDPMSHPNNLGQWSTNIASFVKVFTTAYCRRVARERMTDGLCIRFETGRCKGPSNSIEWSYRLGKVEDEKIIDLFLPSILNGVWTRSQMCATDFESAAKRLAYLAPKAALEPCIERLMEGLVPDAATHQVQSSLRLAAQLLPLIMSNAPEHIASLLTETITHVDPAEPFKTVQALTFHAVVLELLGCSDLADVDVESLMPLKERRSVILRACYSSTIDVDGALIVGASKHGSPLISYSNYPPETILAVKSKAARASVLQSPPSESELRQRVQALVTTSSILPGWAGMYLETVLRFISASSSPQKKGVMQNYDRSVILFIKHAIYRISRDSSEAVTQDLCDVFIAHAATEISPDSRKFTTLVARALAQGNPRVVIDKLLPEVLVRLDQYALHSERSHKSQAEEEYIDSSAVEWWMSILSGLVRVPARYIASYETPLATIIRWAWAHPSKALVKCGTKLLRRVVESTLMCTLENVEETSAEDRTIRRMEAFLRAELPWWLFDLDKLRREQSDSKSIASIAQWYFPTETEFEFAFRFVRLALNQLMTWLRHTLPEADFRPWDLNTETHKSSPTYDASQEAIVVIDKTLASSKDDAKSFAALARMPTLLAASLSSGTLSDIEELPAGVKVLSHGKILSRALALGRHLMKALTPMFPDERPVITPGQPLISSIDDNASIKIVQGLSQCCLTVARIYLGLAVQENNVELVEPSMKLQGVEDFLVAKKLIALVDALLVRDYNTGGIWANREMRGSIWNSLAPWLSVSQGIHMTSSLQDPICGDWAGRLLHSWSSRIDFRTSRHPYIGFRKDLLLLLSRFCNHYYAESRTLAQAVLKDAQLKHNGTRVPIALLHLQDLTEAATALRSRGEPVEAGSGSESSSSEKMVVLAKLTDSAVKLRDTELDVINPPLFPESVLTQLYHARLTGASYILSGGPIARRLWNSPELIELSLNAFIAYSLAPIHEIRQNHRLINLIYQFLNAREPLTVEMKEKLREFLLPKLISELSDKSRPWTASVLCIGLVIVLFPYDDRSGEAFCRIFTERSPHLLQSLAAFGLMLYIRHKLEKNDLSTLSSLLTVELIRAILMSLPHCHHDRGKAAEGVTTGSSVATAILRLDRSWPRSRAVRQGRHFSLHNSLVVENLTRASYALGRLTETLPAFIEVSMSSLDQPLVETDFMTTPCEILGGALRAGASFDEKTKKLLLERFAPVLTQAISKFDQAVLQEFLDALTFAVDSPNADSVASLLIDWILQQHSPPQSLQWTKEYLSSRLSIDLARQLQLTRCLLSTNAGKSNTTVLYAIEPVLPDLLRHENKQVRTETALLLSAAILNTANDSCTPAFVESAEAICKYLSERANWVDRFVADNEGAFSAATDMVPEGREAESILAVFKRVFQACHGDLIDQKAGSMVTLALRLVKIPQPELAGFAANSLNYFSIAPRGLVALEFSNTEAWFILLISLSNHVNRFIEMLEENYASSSWKIRQTCVELAELMGADLRLQLYGTRMFERLVSVCVAALRDSQSEVRTQACASLSNLAVTLTDQMCDSLRTEFTKSGGAPREAHKRPKEDVLACVLGLGALVQSAPFTIPKWMPSTVTLYSRYASESASADVRVGITLTVFVTLLKLKVSAAPNYALFILQRIVQKTLQEFFRTHQDAWRQSHIKHFTQPQLDTLDAYRGRPQYFA